MSEPKKKTSHASQGKRRSHLALTAPSLVPCSNCKSPKLPHVVCPTCGMYDGRQVVVIESAKTKKQ
ncbi:MAG: 50S ribosomal protein L32 [Dehalococcoidia bacterium]|jgi:large subunit ribosomal protein L32|nr:50S ribosomal protein L32 [Dehalococcoidia bacterium]